MNREDLPYEAVYALKTIGRFERFELAFRAVYDAVQDDIRHNRTMHSSVLFEGTWIRTPSGPMFFGPAVDKACREGLIKDGKWVAQPERSVRV